MFSRSTVSTPMAVAARHVLFALCLVAVPHAVSAQATIPGDALLEPTRIRFGTLQYVLTVVRGDEEESFGTLRDELVPLRGDEPLLRRVLTLTQSSSVTIDSTTTILETLAPRWHRSVQPTRDIQLQFQGIRVTGTITPKGSAAKAVETKLVDLAFDASNWDLIARALPLEEGDATVISVFDVDRQQQRYTVRVQDRQVRGKTDIVHVLVEMGKGREAHAWFDDDTRTLLRVETMIGPDVLLRQVLK